MKCNCGADLLDAKFCGECGTAAPAMLGKAICSSEHENLASAKFCIECGEDMDGGVVTAEQYQDVMSALGTLGKSFLPDKIELPIPASVADDDDYDDSNVLGKSALPEGIEQVDAWPVIAALMDGVNAVGAGLRPIGNEVRSARNENRLLAKAVGVIGRAVSDLSARIGGVEASRQPRRAILVPQERHTDGRNVIGTAAPLGGDDLIAKCVVASSAGKLSVDQVARTQEWVGLGTDLAGIKSQDPELGNALESAITHVSQ